MGKKTKKTKIKRSPRIKHTPFQLQVLNKISEGLARSWPPIYRKDGAVYLHASSIGKCPRQLWYWLNEPDKALIRARDGLSIIGSMGTDLHNRVQEILGGVSELVVEDDNAEDSAQLFGIEGRFKYRLIPETKTAPALYISGKKDGHFEIKDRVIFEMKTLGSSQFLLLKSRPVDSKYWAQTQIEMKVFKASRAEFLFVRRSGTKQPTQLEKEEPQMFIRALDYDPNYVEGLKNKLAPVLSKEAPEQLPTEDYGKYTVAPWECSYCSMLLHCRPGAKAGYVTKIKGEEVLSLQPKKWARTVVIEPKEEEKEV